MWQQKGAGASSSWSRRTPMNRDSSLDVARKDSSSASRPEGQETTVMLQVIDLTKDEKATKGSGEPKK